MYHSNGFDVQQINWTLSDNQNVVEKVVSIDSVAKRYHTSVCKDTQNYCVAPDTLVITRSFRA